MGHSNSGMATKMRGCAFTGPATMLITGISRCPGYSLVSCCLDGGGVRLVTLKLHKVEKQSCLMEVL